MCPIMSNIDSESRDLTKGLDSATEGGCEGSGYIAKEGCM